jgi:heat shock protein HtpX
MAMVSIVFAVLGELGVLDLAGGQGTGGASLAGRGSMIAALRRLMASQGRVDTSHRGLATLKISGVPRFGALFSTHPPLEERIAALEGRS